MNHENLYTRTAAQCRLPDFRRALGMFTGRWKLEILWLLYQRGYPVGELRRAMPNITQPVLTAKLQELEADGLVSRRIYEGIRPQVEYELTPGARRFRPFVRAIMKWARQRALSRESNTCRIAPKAGAVGPRA